MLSKRANAQTDKYQIITWEQYHKDVKTLVRKIKYSKKKFKHIYGIPRGGLVLAVHLSHLLNKPLVMNYKKYKQVLIVDDVSDTGHTLQPYKRTHWIATLYKKDHTKTEPTFFARVINKWIIYPWEVI